jgi:23S rRNA (guanosine2251-2'-O)-methyltransferase
MQIEGRNPVLESLRAGANINKIFMNEGSRHDSKVEEILSLAAKQGIEIKFKPKNFLNKMAQTKIHQGVIALRPEARQQTLPELLGALEAQKKDPFMIFIRDAENEYNVGSIIRSAEVAGAHAVILPPKIRMSPQMVRASMGASEHVPVINGNLFQTIKYLKEQNLKVVGIEVSDGKYYYEADLKGPLLLIIGGEDRSLSTQVQEKCDEVVQIPMRGKVNSLNMSIAASIVIFEKLRQELA